MPEGHSIHRIARQFEENFLDTPLAASSPQGRFSEGAALISGHRMLAAKAAAKHLFLEFDNELFLRVHLGLYGAWDFAGEISLDPVLAASNGRMGQTNQHGVPAEIVLDSAGENSLSSIGAPRRARVRMSEASVPGAALETWPPPVVGQVRLRLLSDNRCADLRGPTACQLLDAAGVDAALAKLGPDPLLVDPEEGERQFIRAVKRRSVPIAQLLMDQSVVAGIGNVYRAELLFRAGLDPYRLGKDVPDEVLAQLWRDWSKLLRVGVATGQMLTMDGLSDAEQRAAMANLADRHWVYRRAGLPCRVCGTNIALAELQARKLYWCPLCQK